MLVLLTIGLLIGALSLGLCYLCAACGNILCSIDEASDQITVEIPHG